MMSFIMALLVSTLTGPFKKVEIKSSSGDIRVSIVHSKKIKIPENVKLEKRGASIYIFAGDEDLHMDVPESTEAIIVSSSDGDISVRGKGAASLRVRSGYGDIEVKIDTAGELSVKSRSGSIYVKQHRCGKTTIKSSTGDIVYYGPVCNSLWIFSNSGDINIFASGRPVKRLNVKSIHGDVSIYYLETGKLEILSPEKEKLDTREKFEQPSLTGYVPLYSWQRFPLEYTRVDGFVLNVPVENQDDGDFYQGYVGYSFSARRVDFFLHGMKTAGKFGLYFMGYSERRSPDAIFLSDGENTISSLLLHNSFADFYHGTGLGIYGVLILGRFWTSAGYEREVIKSLEKVTDWSLFYRDSRSFPENPPVFEGTAEFLGVEARYLSEKLFARVNLSRQINTEYGKFTKVVAILRGKWITNGIEVYPSLVAQYSDRVLKPPFDFYLGGPFTLPGYTWKEFHGSKWMYLGSIFGKLSILDQDFFVQIDVGQTETGSRPAIDIGAGVYLDDCYIGIASPVDGEGYRLFGGLDWRFGW